MKLTNKTTSNIGALIGNTPLIKVPTEMTGLDNIEIYAKAEWYNPGGSVKDRAAYFMIKEGIDSGKLTPEKTIIEATSGNTGVGESYVGFHLGYKVLIVAPDNTSPEKIFKIQKKYKADMIFTPKEGETKGAILKVKEIIAENPRKYFFPNQYDNESNVRAHIEGTGPEIANAVDSVDAFVSVVGTGGTALGNGIFLKGHDPNIVIYGVFPDHGMHGFEGIKDIESVAEVGNYKRHKDIIDKKIEISTEDAYDMAEKFVEKDLCFEGNRLPGPSGLGNLLATIMIAERDFGKKEKGKIVTLFPDSLDNYSMNSQWGALRRK
jgi:cysteine synthase B